jgi:hypothetical protein
MDLWKPMEDAKPDEIRTGARIDWKGCANSRTGDMPRAPFLGKVLKEGTSEDRKIASERECNTGRDPWKEDQVCLDELMMLLESGIKDSGNFKEIASDATGIATSRGSNIGKNMRSRSQFDLFHSCSVANSSPQHSKCRQAVQDDLSREASTAASETAMSTAPPSTVTSKPPSSRVVESDTIPQQDSFKADDVDSAVESEGDAGDISNLSSVRVATPSRVSRQRSGDSDDYFSPGVMPAPPNTVMLNVYDLHSSIAGLNDFFQDRFSGGLYHVGVEVYGLEFMYSAGDHGLNARQPCCSPDSESESGILRHCPKQHSVHSFKRSIDMGLTKLSMRSVFSLTDEMGTEWSKTAYHVLNKNCISFANSFCIALGCGSIPSIFIGSKFSDEAPDDPPWKLSSLYSQASAAARWAFGSAPAVPNDTKAPLPHTTARGIAYRVDENELCLIAKERVDPRCLPPTSSRCFSKGVGVVGGLASGRAAYTPRKSTPSCIPI